MTRFPQSPGIAPDVATLLRWLGEHVPSHSPVTSTGKLPVSEQSFCGGRRHVMSLLKSSCTKAS